MQTILHKAQHSIVNKQPFVLYVKPDETILNGWFQKSTDLIAFKEQEGFVFAGFNAAIDRISKTLGVSVKFLQD